MKVSPNIVEEFDMYLRSGGGFHGGVPYGRAGLAGNRPLRAPTTHRAVGRPSGARAELRPRSRRQISAATISFDNRLCGGLSTYTKSLVAEWLTLTLAEFASSLVRTRPHPSATSDTAKLFITIFRNGEEVYGIIPTVPAGEIRGASTLKSGRHQKRRKFLRDGTMQRKCMDTSSLRVSLKAILRPLMRRGREVFLLCQIVSGESRRTATVFCPLSRCVIKQQGADNTTKKDKMMSTKYEPDVNFTIRKWLDAFYWINIAIYSIAYTFFVANAFWHIFLYSIIYVVLLIVNKLCYELSVAVFEIIKHLRQIRDELIAMNARGEFVSE